MSTIKRLQGLVPLGMTVITPAAMAKIDPEDVLAALGRHAQGDWGLVCPEDWLENEISLREGFRLLSVYEDRGSKRFWIITEADRSVTTILLPSDY